QRTTVRSIIGSGVAKAVLKWRTTWSYYTPTVIGRSTCKKDKQKRPRPARGVSECLSCMNGNIHVQFLGEGVAATSPPYPTTRSKPACRPRRKAARGRVFVDTGKPVRRMCRLCKACELEG